MSLEGEPIEQRAAALAAPVGHADRLGHAMTVADFVPLAKQ
ncbi:MAG: hypothetical protein ACJ8CR_35135 [Roseiflexaceae bacterium]